MSMIRCEVRIFESTYRIWLMGVPVVGSTLKHPDIDEEEHSITGVVESYHYKTKNILCRELIIYAC